MIVLATTNKGKLSEIGKIFENICSLESLDNFGFIEEPEEPYETFIENAVHKAKYYATYTKKPTLSDDAGICIDALDGAPGVFSKRFIEECGSVEKMFQQLESKLDGKTKKAYFKCAAALVVPETGEIITAEGVMEGELVFPPREGGLQVYDCIFMPDGFDKTISELGLETKSKISYRSAAMNKLIDEVKKRNLNCII